jgi:hypothetical protein
MTNFVDGIGQAIGQLVANIGNAISGVISTVVHTADSWIPGGFPVFVILSVIAVLVGLATLRR